MGTWAIAQQHGTHVRNIVMPTTCRPLGHGGTSHLRFGKFSCPVEASGLTINSELYPPLPRTLNVIFKNSDSTHLISGICCDREPRDID